MQIGERVVGRFLLESEAGAGAMGIVYRSRDLLTGRLVALKALRTPDLELAQRFAREGEVLASLRHPAIVEYVAHGQSSSGEPFLAMEWLEGASLKQVHAERNLSYVETIDVAMAIGGALVQAHARGIVHRDLKPANVFLVGRSAARVKVLDFGIARLRGAGTLTGTGAVVGTPAFMSPEQVVGVREVDGRSDLFSLGAILFSLVAGAAPFEAPEPLAILLALSTRRAPRVASVAPGTPPRLCAIVDSLLEPKPCDRPADAITALRALAEARAEAIAASTGTPTARPAAPSAFAGTWGTPGASFVTGPTLIAATVSQSSGGSVTSPTAASKPVRRWVPIALGFAGVALFASGIGAALLVGSAGRSKSSATAPRAVETSAVSPAPTSANGKPTWCPADALVCASVEFEPKHADPEALVALAASKIRAIRPASYPSMITANGVTDGGIDFTTGGSLAVLFSDGVVSSFTSDHRFWAFANPQHYDAPLPACSVTEAYKHARKAGIPAARPAVVSITSQGIIVALDNTYSLILDPQTCEPQHIKKP